MQPRTLIAVVVAGVVIVGGAVMFTQAGRPTPTSTCENTAVCRIVVSVSGCTVTIPADKKVIKASGRNVVVLWKLDDQAVKNKFEFDNTAGIVLKSSTPDHGQFFGQMAINNKTGYIWIDRNSDWRDYEYTIDLIDTVNNQHCKLDPIFANN